MTNLNIPVLTILIKAVYQMLSWNTSQLSVYRKDNLNTATGKLPKHQWENEPCNRQLKENISIYINVRKDRYQTEQLSGKKWGIMKWWAPHSHENHYNLTILKLLKKRMSDWITSKTQNFRNCRYVHYRNFRYKYPQMKKKSIKKKWEVGPT